MIFLENMSLQYGFYNCVLVNLLLQSSIHGAATAEKRRVHN